MQEVREELFFSELSNLSHDLGEDWEYLTIFGSLRYQNINFSNYNYSKLFRRNNFFRINSYNFKISTLKYSIRKDHRNLFLFLTPTIEYQPSKKRSATSFLDYSAVGFQNRWVTVQFNRGNESWSSGKGLDLALSQSSKSYEYFKLTSDYGSMKVNYIHGFLEKTENNINRYITAKGVEWSNNKSFIIGLSETIIYSGENRNIEFGYFNPISSHLEVEWNKRLSHQSEEDGNAVWQISSDILLKRKVRLCFNFLFDELTIDDKKKRNRSHATAMSLRISFPLSKSFKNKIILYSNYIYVGTPTFRHGSGYNNFVQKNVPLGWEYGSDSNQSAIGINHFSSIVKKIIFSNFEINYRKEGEENILYRPYSKYKDFTIDSFPSWENIKNLEFKSVVKLWYKSNLSVDFNFNIGKLNTPKKVFKSSFGVNFYI